MLVGELSYRGRGGVIIHNNMLYWGFYSEVAEELLEYIDDNETNTCSIDTYIFRGDKS